ncbi:MAG: NAD-dependent epimerase/dehydratase family protein [Bdellovibrio sp.]
MKVLVTGGSGFIGSRLVKVLVEEGAQVHVLTRAPQKYDRVHGVVTVKGDLATDISIDLSSYEVIYHCAGEISNPEQMYKVHVEGTLKLLKQVEPRTRWVQLSSVGVYGSRIADVVCENNAFAPVGDYEKTKAESEALVKRYCIENGIAFSVLRPSIVFGRDMKNQSIIQLIHSIKSGRFVYFSNPASVVMNYVHVDDVVDALLMCGMSERAVGQDYIVNDPISLKDLVGIVSPEGRFLRVPKYLALFLTKVLEILKIKSPITESRVRALTNKTIYSSRKIEDQLDFRYLVGVEKGVREMVDFYIRQNDSIQ